MEPENGLEKNMQNDSSEVTNISSTNMPMDNDTSTNVSSETASQDKPKKKSHAMAIGMVFLAILAIGGIGFGIWAWTNGEAQNKRYEENIANLRNQLAEAMKPVEEEVIDNEVEDDNDNDNDNEEDVDTAGYIYIGQWGLKIGIPDNLTVTGYRYNMMAGYTSVGVSGNTKGGQYFPEFADLSKTNSPLGTIARYPKGTEMPLESPPVLVFSDEQYDYYYYHPQMVISTEENEQKWEVESTDAIERMLNDKDSYSSI